MANPHPVINWSRRGLLVKRHGSASRSRLSRFEFAMMHPFLYSVLRLLLLPLAQANITYRHTLCIFFFLFSLFSLFFYFYFFPFHSLTVSPCFPFCPLPVWALRHQ